MNDNNRAGFSRRRSTGSSLDREKLERLGLFYVGRYATTKARLRAYLQRKLDQRGWSEDMPPPVEDLVERLSALGYVDDAAFASSRTAALQRRGYGGRRIEQALRGAGVAEEERQIVRDQSESGAVEAAMRFAKRKRIGPFAAGEPDRATRQKAFGALMRAGHSSQVARMVLDLAPGEEPE